MLWRTWVLVFVGLIHEVWVAAQPSSVSQRDEAQTPCPPLVGWDRAASVDKDVAATILAVACSSPDNFTQAIWNDGGNSFSCNLKYPNGTSYKSTIADYSFTGKSSEISFTAAASLLTAFKQSLPGSSESTMESYLLPAFFSNVAAPLGAGWCDVAIYQGKNLANPYPNNGGRPVLALLLTEEILALQPCPRCLGQVPQGNIPGDLLSWYVQYWNVSTGGAPSLDTMDAVDWYGVCSSLVYPPFSGSGSSAGGT